MRPRCWFTYHIQELVPRAPYHDRPHVHHLNFSAIVLLTFLRFTCPIIIDRRFHCSVYAQCRSINGLCQFKILTLPPHVRKRKIDEPLARFMTINILRDYG